MGKALTRLEQIALLEAKNIELRKQLNAAIKQIKPHHTICANREGCNYISAVTRLPDCCACEDWEWEGKA
jgi:hypothetical protein